jgi:hypothetical protein
VLIEHVQQVKVKKMRKFYIVKSNPRKSTHRLDHVAAIPHRVKYPELKVALAGFNWATREAKRLRAAGLNASLPTYRILAQIR